MFVNMTLYYDIIDEQKTNLTGICDMLARVLNEQQNDKKKIETLQGKLENSTAEFEKTKAELQTLVEENKKRIDKLDTGNMS